MTSQRIPETLTPSDLHQWRLGHSMHQAMLAEQLGVTAMTIHNWEHGHSPIPRWLTLALRGLSFTHGPHCSCRRCYGDYGDPLKGRRDPQPLRHFPKRAEHWRLEDLVGSDIAHE